jgi:hypothetical protein
LLIKHLKQKISLQINLSPGDYPHARLLLKHQLNRLSGQADEILLTVDTRASKGRFSNNWDIYRDQLNAFIEQEITPVFNVRTIFVNYDPESKAAVGRFFFGSNRIPDKDFRGGPFYAYFYGLYHAKNDLVFHIDSDIFLGGGSPTWVQEAADLLLADQAVLTVSPLPGPPHPDDRLIGQPKARKTGPYIFSFDEMSTRIFMLDKSRFGSQKLLLKRPDLRSQIKAIMERNANAALPEHLISDFIKQHGLMRIDFLGTGSGLWSLHPPFRTQTFYESLPELIAQVERGALPEKQLGYYDLIDEVCDWTEAREYLKEKRWWKKYPLIYWLIRQFPKNKSKNN